MRVKALIPVILIALLIGYYLDNFTHRTIYVRDIKSITVDSKQYTPDKNLNEIMKIASMFNEAQRFRKDYDTTPSHNIVIQLINDEKVQISGNTQSFQYVHEENKDYKISGKRLTEYFRSLDEIKNP